MIPVRLLDPTCGPAGLRLLLRRVGLADAGDQTECSAGQAMYVWVASLLANRKPVGPDAADVVLEVFKEALLAAGDRIAQAEEFCKENDVVFLSILDGTYAAVGTETYDLRTAEKVSGPLRPPVEAAVYNLVELYRMHTTRIRDRKDADRARQDAVSRKPPPTP